MNLGFRISVTNLKTQFLGLFTELILEWLDVMFYILKSSYIGAI